LHTKYGRGLAAKGVQPICTFQQLFKSTYLYGAFSPINGDKLILELPYCNSECFQLFLDIMSKQNEDEFKIIVLDNGAFHKAKNLKIPSNILLLFLPPYSPELNPAEKIWHNFKRLFTNQYFKTLDEVSEFFIEVVRNLTSEKVKSICSFKYIFSGLNWSV
jgi:transposase